MTFLAAICTLLLRSTQSVLGCMLATLIRDLARVDTQILQKGREGAHIVSSVLLLFHGGTR